MPKGNHDMRLAASLLTAKTNALEIAEESCAVALDMAIELATLVRRHAARRRPRQRCARIGHPTRRGRHADR